MTLTNRGAPAKTGATRALRKQLHVVGVRSNEKPPYFVAVWSHAEGPIA